MTTLASLKLTADVHTQRMVKLHTRLMGKFKSNPALTAGLILRLRTELEELETTRTVVPIPLKLKDIDLPEFHGEPRKFFEYKDLFETLVHRNTKYSNQEKMILLRQSLKGEAEKLLSNSINDVSYPEAWGAVCEWYENRFLIVNALFRDLFALKPIKDSSLVRNLLLEVDSILRGLRSAGQETEHWSSLLQYFVSSKLDDETRRDWLNSRDTTSAYPGFAELKKFLISRCHAVEAGDFKVRVTPQSVQKQSAKSPKPNSPKQPRKSYAATTSSPGETCICCGELFHLLIHCDKFKSQSPYQRYEMVRSARLCNNCFNANHIAVDCPKSSCKTCGLKHHTLLHFEKKKPPSSSAQVIVSPVAQSADTSSQAAANSSCATVNSVNKFVLLPTAVVEFASDNVIGLLRVLFDSASQSTLAVDTLVDKYKLKVSKSVCSIVGVGGNVISSSRSCRLKLRSRVSRFEIEVDADVVPASAITYSIPSNLPFSSRARTPNLLLAEKSIGYNTIDMILGNEYYDRCVLESTITFDKVLYKNTEFGWTPTGPIGSTSSCQTIVNQATCLASTRQIQDDLKKFWAIEEVAPVEACEPEHVTFDKFFNETYRRDDNGRFVVHLPLKMPSSLLGESRSRALRSLLHNERHGDPAVRAQYVEFLHEYEKLGHMTLVPEAVPGQNRPIYYINHHAVLRPSSTTTKLRVVFNASAPTLNGPSLNKILMQGPKYQSDLFDILLSFRKHAIAFSADIAKMYRQVAVREEDRDLQRILWRPDSSQPIREYQLNTVTYGTASASFLATKCLDTVASEIAKSSPAAANAIREQCYMDDLLCSCPSVAEAIELQQAVHNALEKACFPLRKYISNSPALSEEIDPTLIETAALEIEAEIPALVLGIVWAPTPDSFRIKITPSHLKIPDVVTKRFALSASAKIFDPLGLVSPVSVRFKILLQSLWKEDRGWDDPITTDNRDCFVSLMNDLPALCEFEVRRSVSSKEFDSRRLVGFCDASLSAYCAAVYVQSWREGDSPETYLVCAKTKVAPISKLKSPTTDDHLTIHRLELMGALLLVQLLERVARRLNFPLAEAVAFSDSQVVLCWLAKPAETWSQFIRNRVAKIQEILPYSQWGYVRSAENPSDLGTRGTSASALVSSKLWVNGPTFLTSRDSLSPAKVSESINFDPLVATANLMSAVSSPSSCAVAKRKLSPFSTFSSFCRLQNTVARILRWKNLRSKKSAPPFSPEEMNRAFFAIVKWSQRVAFPDEVRLLQDGKMLDRRSPLWYHSPFLDADGVLRISGRLANAPTSVDSRHPALVSSKCEFVELYARYVHAKFFHAGKNFLIAFLSARFRFVGGINVLCKRIVRKCVICARYNKRPPAQLMAQLPADRVTINPPFSSVMVDHAGPFQTKCVGHRTTVHFKSYLCVFVCLTTKAVHLEISSGLDAESFLDAFQRFVARRGAPRRMFSDNGTAFVKAQSVLQLDWNFGPPYGPHHQGLVEAAIKSVKRCLFKVTKERILTFEEYNTLFCRIEAVLNSRPLCRHGDGYLTPGHFLTGDHLLQSPEMDDDEVALNVRFHVCRKIFRDFWASWSRNYLNDLNNRTKWLKSRANVKVGDVALFVQPNTKPASWPLALVTAVHPGSDQLVRKVTVRVDGKEYLRPITKLILLPLEGSSSEPSPGTV